VKLLLDTHAFLWFVTGDRHLTPRARRVMESDDAELILSAASVWEMAIKARLGRLTLPATVEEYIAEKITAGFRILPVEWQHGATVEQLPLHHRDPFDWLLVAQALAEGLPVVTGDRAFRAYGVKVIW
jgi:PIN domain nuclease of toxin-antitoxin system